MNKILSVSGWLALPAVIITALPPTWKDCLGKPDQPLAASYSKLGGGAFRSRASALAYRTM